MRAMILAAGRGERMRPLTDTTPKPLLKVKGKALISWHVERLMACGYNEIVVNLGHLGYKIQEYLEANRPKGVKIFFSDEQQSGALESAGGIIKALPLLGDAPFLVVNGDVFCDYTFDVNFKLHGMLAHLILVENPEHNLRGDFGLKDGFLLNHSSVQYTFSGIGYYDPKLFASLDVQKMPLAPLLRKAAEQKQMSAEIFHGMWHDVGTPQRLQQLNGEIF